MPDRTKALGMARARERVAYSDESRQEALADAILPMIQAADDLKRLIGQVRHTQQLGGVISNETREAMQYLEDLIRDHIRSTTGRDIV